jgi:hypothetical protein
LGIADCIADCGLRIGAAAPSIVDFGLSVYVRLRIDDFRPRGDRAAAMEQRARQSTILNRIRNLQFVGNRQSQNPQYDSQSTVRNQQSVVV